MKLIIFITYIFLSTSSQANSGVSVLIPPSWFKLNSKILLNESSTLYAMKKNSKAQVIHQETEIKPTFKEVTKDLKHHCRIYKKDLKSKGGLVKGKQTNYCFLPESNSVFMVTENSKSKRYLHHFKFTHMTDKEIEAFVAKVSIR